MLKKNLSIFKGNKILIVAPSTVLPNWKNEFQKWLLPENCPSLYILQGNFVILQNFKIKKFKGRYMSSENRLHLVNEWYTNGGVLLIGINFFY